MEKYIPSNFLPGDKKQKRFTKEAPQKIYKSLTGKKTSSSKDGGSQMDIKHYKKT